MTRTTFAASSPMASWFWRGTEAAVVVPVLSSLRVVGFRQRSRLRFHGVEAAARRAVGTSGARRSNS